MCCALMSRCLQYISQHNTTQHNTTQHNVVVVPHPPGVSCAPFFLRSCPPFFAAVPCGWGFHRPRQARQRGPPFVLWGRPSSPRFQVLLLAISDVFRGKNYGVGCPGGVEVVAHSLRDTLQRHADSDLALLKIDFKNAFNNVDRSSFMSTSCSALRQMSSWTNWCYSAPSVLLYLRRAAGGSPWSSLFLLWLGPPSSGNSGFRPGL